MSDGGTKLTTFLNTHEVHVDIPAGKGAAPNAQASRKLLEDAVRGIPDSALKGFRSFRITVMA